MLLSILAFATAMQAAPPTRPDGETGEFLGYGHVCNAQVGEGDLQLSGMLFSGIDGKVNELIADSVMLPANQKQVLAKGGKSTEPWLYMGTLRWKMHWGLLGRDLETTGQKLTEENGYLFFDLESERPLPDRLFMATAQSNGTGAELVVPGLRLNGRGHFATEIKGFLAFGSRSWVVVKPPYGTSHPEMKDRYGHGVIELEKLKQMSNFRIALEGRLLEMNTNREAQCDKQPIYESNGNDIVI
jgi:hypothetical protein